MNDLSPTIAPKSDQMNADDLIAGPRTIRISRVSVDVGGEQPVALNFEGDNGKPYRPCKSMRRVLVALWGPDGAQYAGRSMTLYRDDSVQFGGLAVGGIRISHMSDIDAEKTLVLTATKKSRKPFTVRRLDPPKKDAGFPLLKPDGGIAEIPARAWLRGVEKAIAFMEDAAALAAWRAAMGPHLASMAEAGQHEMVEQAERLIDLRRDQFAADAAE
jgi:hypothetical protein